MNNAIEEVKGQSAAMVGADNVVEIRAGGVLPELDDQPLPVDAEVVVAEELSLVVQIRQARIASRALSSRGPGWWGSERWATATVVAGAILVVVAGLLTLVQ